MTQHRLQRAALVFGARGTELFGRSGWLGLALCALAAVWFAYAWGQRLQPLEADVAEPVAAAPSAQLSPSSIPATGTLLPRQDEQALVLTQIQQVAVSQGLGWAAADYKLVPAGESTPMALEVRCTLKGTYPHLRGALAQWLQQIPGLAIRELALSRPSSEVVEVEAKLQLVVFMRAATPEARP